MSSKLYAGFSNQRVEAGAKLHMFQCFCDFCDRLCGECCSRWQGSLFSPRMPRLVSKTCSVDAVSMSMSLCQSFIAAASSVLHSVSVLVYAIPSPCSHHHTCCLFLYWPTQSKSTPCNVDFIADVVLSLRPEPSWKRCNRRSRRRLGSWRNASTWSRIFRPSCTAKSRR